MKAFAPVVFASVAALALPFQTERRTHAILIDPAKVPSIQGPRRIAGGSAIEYVLPNGCPDTALAFAWALPAPLSRR